MSFAGSCRWIARAAIAIVFVTAKDNVDGTVPVTCAPASGSTFVVGSTKVTCTAVDKKGNKGTSILSVTVTAAQ